MAQPTTYNRVASFASFQALNPTTPLPGSSVDQEFNAVKITLDQVGQNLALIQRDDGELANGSVGLDQLSSEVTVGFEAPVVWTTATAFATSNTVFHGSGFYRCLVAHTSGVFATDLSALKWELIVDLSSIVVSGASQVAFSPTGGVSSTDVQAAIAELDAEKAAVSHTHPASAITDSTTAGRALLTAADLSAQLAILGIASIVPAYGDIRDTAALTPPTGWVFAYGQAISRTTYAGYFAAVTIQQTGTRSSGGAIVTALTDTSNMRAGMPACGTGVPSGTTILSVDGSTQITLSANATSSGSSTVIVAPWGAGDGSTTINVPDLRGRTRTGRDDMGGSAASRVTATFLGTSAARLGATGGVESFTIAQANLPDVAFTVSGITLSDTRTWGWSKDGSNAGVTGATDAILQPTGHNTTLTGTVTVTSGSLSVSAQGTAASGGSGTAKANLAPTGVVNTIVFVGP